MIKFVLNSVRPISKRIGKFFGNRMPVGDRISLSQRSSYIWPVRAGYFLLVIVVLMMIGATNYQNNLAFMLTFLVVGIGLSAIILTYKNLQGIEFSLQNEGELFAKRAGNISIALRSLSGNFHSAVGMGLRNEESVWCNVPAEGVERVRLSLIATERGYLKLPRFRVTSLYPFGWFRVWGYFGFASPVLVYPQPIEPPQLVEDSGNSDFDEGEKKSGSDEFYGLKQYQAGEPLSRIDWKSYARERGIYVREFANYQGQQLCFDWQSFEGYPVESRVSFLTFLVEQAANQNLGYSLKIPGTFMAFSEGEKHRKACLKALAIFDKSEVVESESAFVDPNNDKRAS